MVMLDRQLILIYIGGELGISPKRIYRIIVNVLDIHTVLSLRVPKLLSADHKHNRVKTEGENLVYLERGLDTL